MELKSKYHPKKYIEFVEQLQDSVLDKYMEHEIAFINDILKKKSYHVLDLGAGYGRIIPKIKNNTERITAIEIDSEMFKISRSTMVLIIITLLLISALYTKFW